MTIIYTAEQIESELEQLHKSTRGRTWTDAEWDRFERLMSDLAEIKLREHPGFVFGLSSRLGRDLLRREVN